VLGSALDGNHGAGGPAVVLRQGLWAWMTLVAAQQADDDPGAARVRDVASATTPPSLLPTAVRDELLAVWTDLVVGVVTRQEVFA
jgi:hypothetical protein